MKITVEATINATPGQVWEFWTLPEHITQWNFATDDWHCPHASNDLRKGGEYRTRMEAKDGSIGFDFGGIYDDVIEHKKITYTMGDGRQSTTTFESLGEAVKVTTIFDAEATNSADMQRDGWQSILNNFKKYAESDQSTKMP